MKISKKARLKFEATDNYLNKIALVLRVSESSARRYWKSNALILTTFAVVNIIERETGLAESEILDIQP